MHPFDRLRQTRMMPFVLGFGLIAVAILLIRLSHILPPFIWAAVTAYLLFPVVARLERRLHLPRVAAIAVVYVVLIGFLVIAGFQIVPLAVNQVRSLATELPDLIANAREELVKEPEIRYAGFVVDTREVDARIDKLAQEVAERFGREAVPLVLHTVELLIKTLVYLLTVFYFLLHGDTLLRKLRELAPPRHQETVRRVTGQVNGTFGAYIRGQLILFVIMSAATFVVLTILGVEYALVLALATGALELIPIIGPWSAGTIAVLVALSQGTAPYGWSQPQLAIAVGISYFVLRMIEDHFVIPQLIGRIVRLHPILVIFGVLAGASLGGMLGLLLAVPTLAAGKIIVIAIVDELRHPPVRHVVTIRERDELAGFTGQLESYRRQHVVMLVVPGAFDWDDLEQALNLANQALLHDIRLQVVTPDQVAASIATAAGIEVVTRVRLGEESVPESDETLDIEGGDMTATRDSLGKRLRQRLAVPIEH